MIAFTFLDCFTYYAWRTYNVDYIQNIADDSICDFKECYFLQLTINRLDLIEYAGLNI